MYLLLSLDRCCHCNEAAYEVVAGITEANIVYCADKNEVPYMRNLEFQVLEIELYGNVVHHCLWSRRK